MSVPVESPVSATLLSGMLEELSPAGGVGGSLAASLTGAGGGGGWDGLLLASLVGFLVVSLVLTRLWMLVSWRSLQGDGGSSHGQTRLQTLLPVIGTMATALFLCAMASRAFGGIPAFEGPGGLRALLLVFIAAGILGSVLQVYRPVTREYVFGACLSTIIVFSMLGLRQLFLSGPLQSHSFVLAVAFVVMVLLWKMLFGPWRLGINVTILFTCIFWMGFVLYWSDPPAERLARILAVAVALVPAVVWCLLFLDFHRQKPGLVILHFLGGMLSTIPVLFYDMLVRGDVEFQFLLLRVVPENFTAVSSSVISGSTGTMTGIQTTLLSTFVAFSIVGLIEEVGKFWVLRRSGERFFSSIDDVVQLSIMVSVGFAFAENIINPTYFLGFVRQYLLDAPQADWMGFMGNVVGRSVLTTMVHIFSGGVLGYFYGRALFAGPALREHRENGRSHPVVAFFALLLRLPHDIIYRRLALVSGLLCAVLLHGFFNFFVSLPDLLPGSPKTLGDLAGAGPSSPLSYISLLLIPSLFYVVGGFWLLTFLLLRDESSRERGRIIRTESFVTGGGAL